MPSENTGKLITKVKINKKNVVLYFGKQKLAISPEAYSLGYLYAGKNISLSEIKKLKEYTAIAGLLNYALTLLKKGHYSEWRMREKLYAKEGKKKDIDFVIKRLKDIDLINDRAYIENHLAYAEEREIGKNKIVKELLDRGIFQKDVDKIKFSPQIEKKKALSQVKRLERKYASCSYEKKKQKIYQSLLSLGFDSSLANEALEKVSHKDESDEQKKIAKDYEHLYLRLSVRYEEEELKGKIVTSLRNKGYRYSDIRRIMEEKFNGND